jgi:hypothetical protein
MSSQLHCLNFLRKITYKEHYDPLGGDLADPPKKLRIHLGKTLTTTNPE